jgi:hypothetical protein
VNEGLESRLRGAAAQLQAIIDELTIPVPDGWLELAEGIETYMRPLWDAVERLNSLAAAAAKQEKAE